MEELVLEALFDMGGRIVARVGSQVIMDEIRGGSSGGGSRPDYSRQLDAISTTLGVGLGNLNENLARLNGYFNHITQLLNVQIEINLYRGYLSIQEFYDVEDVKLIGEAYRDLREAIACYSALGEQEKLKLAYQGYALCQYLLGFLEGNKGKIKSAIRQLDNSLPLCSFGEAESTRRVMKALHSMTGEEPERLLVFANYTKSQPRTFTVGGVTFKMVRVEHGPFMMGDDKDPYCPKHQVKLTKDYYMGEVPVTQALWKAVIGRESNKNGGWISEYGCGDNYPAYRVSYEVIVNEFLPNLNDKVRNQLPSGMKFCLPTEAQWEFAARGGNKEKDKNYMYSGSNSVDGVAWYSSNSGSKTHPVGGKTANGLGLYDMSGNVWEWCNDWYSSNYYKNDQTDPKGPNSGSCRVFRGGSWNFSADFCRVSFRNHWIPDDAYDGLGFRLCLSEL